MSKKSGTHLLWTMVGSAVLVVASCTWNAPRDEAVSYQMRGHYADVGIIQRALVAGELRQARDAASRVSAMTEVPGTGPEGDAWVPRIRDIAGEIENADTYAHATAAAGRLAATCGACHLEMSRGPDFRAAVQLPEDTGFSGHMIRHVWAADRMFEGLVASSDELWAAGAGVFADDPLHGDAIPPAAEPHAKKLHQLGLGALQLEAPRDRARQYGLMLAECGACHAEMGVAR